MVDVRLLLRRAVWPANAAALSVGFATYGAFVLIPRFVQIPEATGYGLGASASASGLFVLPYSVATLVFGTLSGVVSRRWGPRTTLIAGAVAAFSGYAQLGFLHGSPLDVLVGSSLLGCGTGLIVSSIATVVVHGVGSGQTGVALGVNAIMRTIGGAFGGQVAAAMLNAGGRSAATPPESRFTLAFCMSAAAALAVLAAAAMVRGGGRVPPDTGLVAAATP
jgi:MFS family permease